MKKWKYLTMTAVLGSALLLGACGGDDTEDATNTGDNTEQTETGDVELTGQVLGDGSSTVAPIIDALVEEYAAAQPKVQVSSGISGTGGGFEKFIAGETHFTNASRPIKDEEKALLEEAGVDYTEFLLANDGLTVVIHPDNDWATDLTVEQLKELWIEDGTDKKWSDIDPSWPDETIEFFSPGTDSGTYDYFNEVILEDADLVRSAQLSEDDNVLVQGVAANPNAIGFFGFAYYLENTDKLVAVKVDGVEPTSKTIESGEYSPLSRPLFVYASNEALKENEAFYNFMEFTMNNAGDMADAVGYVRLTDDLYEEGLTKLEELK